MTLSTPGEAGSRATRDGSGAGMTRDQLQARLMGFADRYLNTLSEATDQLQARLPTPECRLAAQATRFYPSQTVLSLACDPEPDVALLDLLVVVTLERMVWEGEWSEAVFHEHAPILTAAQRRAEADIWGVAASVMAPEQITEMRGLIEEWRRQNPERRYVSSTRFDDFAGLRDKRQSPAFTLNLFFAPVDEATRAVDETRRFGERALFLVQHLPVLLNWQAELLVSEIAMKPEVRLLLEDTHAISGAASKHADAADRFAAAVQQFPKDLRDHREALIKELENQEGVLRTLVADARAGLKEADAVAAQVEAAASHGRELAASLEKTMATADAIAARFRPEGEPAGQPAAGPGRAFDIREYSEAAERLTHTLEELNRTMSGTDRMLASPSWEQWMGRVDQMTERRVEAAGAEMRDLIDRLFWRAAALVVLIGVVVYGASLSRRRAGGRADARA